MNSLVNNNDWLSSKESVDSLLNKLKDPENLYTNQLEKIECMYSNLSNNQIINLTSRLNICFSNDKWVEAKWSFIETLKRLET